MKEFKMENIGEFIKKMNDLEKKAQDRVAWGAAKAGANVIKKKAQINASLVDNPASKESIEKNIKVQKATKIAKKGEVCAYRIGVMGGAKTEKSKKDAKGSDNPGGATFYWRFLEFGTSKTRAKPFLRNAASESVGQAFNAVAEVFWKKMEKELK